MFKSKMFKNCKKADLIEVAKELGEVVPDNVTIGKLKEIIESSETAETDLEFVKDLINSIREECDKLEKLDREERDIKFELQKLKITLAHDEHIQITAEANANGNSNGHSVNHTE